MLTAHANATLEKWAAHEYRTRGLVVDMTAEDISNIDIKDLLSLKGVGETSIRALRVALQRLGLDLRSDIEYYEEYTRPVDEATGA